MLKLVITAGLALSACSNPNYCPGNPDNNCNESGAPDARPIDGMESLDCVAMGCSGGQVCDTGTHACVECTTQNATACSGTEPVCRNDACGACLSNPECTTSNACMPDGSCATTVAFVDAASAADNGTCDQQNPCKTLGAALTHSSVVRVIGQVHDTLTVATGTVTLIGDHDAQGTITSGLTATTGNIVTVTGGGSVTLVDLDLDGSTTATNGVTSSSTGMIELDHCIVERTTDFGVFATAGTVRVHRTTVRANHKGGIDLFNAMFAIDNSFIVNNGANIVGGIGGVVLGQGQGTLAFSTIANNDGQNGAARGVVCTNVTSAFTSNILFGNRNSQAGGDCTWTYSDFDTTTGAMPSGAGNTSDMPMFIDADNGNYHLMTASTLRDKGDPASSLPIDIDGNPRPQGNARDIGADELMP